MKVKDIERTANVAWSPKNQDPIYLAAGTAAQQLDASFNTSASLEIYSLNLTEPGPDMKQISSMPSEQRFHKIIWGSYGGDQSKGTIIGGCDEGLVQIYSASKLLKGEDAIIGKQQKHKGPVHALDFNSFQQNLFATGAGDSEIFIWDLNNTNTPMSPGAKSQPLEDVLSVAWNKQVQHILASAFASKCVIWDLRKNEPIIKITDTVSRIRWKTVTWHPEVATQLCLASEEDHSPIIQLWDLRFATSPLKTLENHQRGILSISWCADDSDLLVSCGKDDRIICWNPNSNQQNGEVLSEIAKTNQWSFDVVWCPKNPALIACPNFDGHVSIYSVMGGKTQQIQTTNKIADSFPGMEGYVQAPVPQQNTAPVSADLSKPPKWLKKPVGASFGFGGKLITFENDKEDITQAHNQPGQPVLPVRRTVQISQVITEAEFVQKSAELEKALEYGNFTEYCLNKSDSTNDQHKKYIWHFLKANFEPNSRAELLNLLGYRIEDINSKLSQHLGKDFQNNVDGLTDQFSNINRLDDFSSDDPFNSISQQNNIKKPVPPFKIKTGEDTEGLITQALLLNNVEAAVELCLKAQRYADALIIATTGGPDLLARTQHTYLEQSEGYVSTLISAIVSEDWASIINNCDITSWKEALAAALTHASDDDLPILCEQLGSRLERDSKNNPKLSEDAQLCYICSGSFEKLVSSWSGNAMNSTKDLQELVELVSFLQKSIERQGKKVQVSGALADLLSHYSSLLASQGNLTTALSYLGSSQNEKVASLRDRLLTSLGQKPTNVQELRQQQNRRSSTRTSFTNYPTTFNQTNPFHSQNQYGATQPPAPAPPTSQFGHFNTGLPNASVNSQPWQMQSGPPAPPPGGFSQPGGGLSQPPKAFSPAPQGPPPSQPPRPASVGSQHGGSSGLPSRKYILDPSVTSNQYPGTNQFTPLPSQHTSYQNNTFSNTPYSPSPLAAPFNPAAPNPAFNPSPLIPTSTPAMPNAPLNPLVPVQSYGASSTSSLSQPPVEVAQPATNFMASAPSGWNDPPAFTKSTRQQAKQDLSAQEPITHPIYGAAPAQSLPTNGYGDVGAPPTQPYNPTPLYPQNAPSMYQPPQQTAFNPGGFNQNAIPGGFNQNAIPGGFNQNAVTNVGNTPQGVQGVQQQEIVKPATPVPIQKPAIPEEHVHMQTVFDELKSRCSCAANNPQTKRKLEDVGKKLEALYDCLRYSKLSTNALESLHQLVQFIQNGDYANGLHLHTQLVQGPDFAQIAGFMPGLKVLLQSAIQLQVYLN